MTWLLGSDEDLHRVGSLVGAHALGAITMAQTLHFMDYARLFNDAKISCAPGVEWPSSPMACRSGSKTATGHEP